MKSGSERGGKGREEGRVERQRTMYTNAAQLSLVNFSFPRAPLRGGAVHIQGRSSLLS